MFAGEPRNPERYPADFEAAGFRVACEYESRIEVFDRAGGASEIPEGDVVAIRNFEAERFDDELATLHAISLEGFRDNAYYTPLSFDAFRTLYEPFRGRFDLAHPHRRRHDDD